MSVNKLNAPTHVLTGQACYMRLQEAAGKPSPTDTLRQLRQLLEQLFRYLTKEETRSFGNLFARMQFFFDKHSVPAALQEQLTALRILTHKAVIGTLIADEELSLICIQTMAHAIQHFYEVPIPPVLEQQYTSVKDRVLRYTPQFSATLIPQLKCLITDIGPLQKRPDQAPYFLLSCRNDDLGAFQLMISESVYAHTTLLHKQLRAYDTVHILHCSKTEAPDLYEAVNTTRIILEPDLLIDISDLAECFGPRGAGKLLYLVKKLVPQTPGIAAFKGNVVNALLDNVLRNPEMDLRQSFVDAVSENVLQAAAYGRTELNNMFTDIRTKHWPNLLQSAAELHNRPVRIEPTFFSALYGLQGRLDILAEDEGDALRKEIFELKSGRCPDYGAWKNHEMQVVGYNLLLQSAFGNERRGSSAILYSSANDTPLRNVSSNRPAENELLVLRNEVVSQLLRLAAGEYEILDQITIDAAEGLPSFITTHFTAFHEAYTTASPLLRIYYQQFLSFMLREYLLAKCGMYSAPDREDDSEGFAALWLLSEQEKLERFNIIPGLQFRHFDAESSTVVFNIHIPVNHNFRTGDTAIIYPRSSDGLFPLRHQVLKGRIDALGKASLTFSLNNRQIAHDFFGRQQLWVIEHDIYESNYWVAATALFHVLEPRFIQRMELLLGQRAPLTTPLDIPCPQMFNDNQQSILQAALEAQDYYLVQGPPGTGKTSALLTALVSALVNTGTQTTIVAFTNRAVEEICRKLDDKGISYLRMGSRRSAAESQLRQYCLNGDIEGAGKFITSQQVFVGTVATMATRLHLLQLLGVKMDTLIADEASQLTEPQLLGLLMPFRKFILIGDHNQLPPVVAQADHFCQATHPLLTTQGITDLRCTLFERLVQRCKTMQWHHAWGMLNTHFRMHNDIASLINHYYAGQLSAGNAIQSFPYSPEEHTGTDNWSAVLSKGRTLFIPSPHEPTSKMHRTEAQQVVSLLRHLKEKYGHRFNSGTVGVVTPWRTQISLIRELIGEDEQLQTVNIDTAERFQGAENDIIIVSLAVYHPVQLGQLQNLGAFHWEDSRVEVDRKLLVTLSRARHQVIVMGHEPALRASRHYANLLNSMVRCS
ncbi:DEAD/DEAH box helicase [Chitinophaga sp. S165]|uniref:DEAD/DEAH box helicase n=1 Tax=Chitinophaga sp. S165 TaxID=2135462 RepID=UPI000D71B676|nr:ATP-dependent helicase [Chitinophaga sp. S165]PWV53964.1 PD-(D/E)XK nuclease superfamily protein [Chitinophaga sp. S165]